MSEGLELSGAAALCSVWVRTKARIIQTLPGQAIEGQRDKGTEGQRDGTGALRVEVI